MPDEQKKVKKLFIDPEVCIGCGACEVTAPEYFELGNEGIATPKQNYNEADKEIIEEAIENCPVKAISIKDSSI